MRQLTQKLKNGQMQVLDAPMPMLGIGMVLVKNHYSLISAGTESSTVSAARRGLIGKAKERPQQVKQVLEVFQQQGVVQTYRTVMKKLDAYSSLGYSSAGEVIEVSPDVKGFALGDLVGCGGGGYANHAEVVSVPQNLCVKLPQDANLTSAAYNTVGAIALQGIRQADLRIGETCAVIGLGLIGQLTCLILRAGGIKVFGIDINQAAVDIAKKHAADFAFIRSETGLEEKIEELTEGIGTDAAIITAATSSTDPINFAGRVLRKKGRVVVVGDVPTGFDREPYFYRKELELRMSCSYGPGRYDLNYEEKGIDYPAGYVRWTEKRNMQAFQGLLHSGKIKTDYLSTHIFKLEDAPLAYDMILKRNELFFGILIEYDKAKDHRREAIVVKDNIFRAPLGSVNVAFVGAGSYAMSYLLPNIVIDKDVILKGVMTLTGTSSKTVAEKYGFEFCSSNEADIFGSEDINTVFVATRHDTHAVYVKKALRAGKRVFVEKPLCLTMDDLEEIRKIFDAELISPQQPLLMVGFNRRFSPLVKLLKTHFGSGTMSMLYRINAGYIPSGTWIQDEEIGGGRIIGEVCHFVDLLSFINGSLPASVFATAMPTPANTDDTIQVNLLFRNGSIGTISYLSNGSKSLFKEYIEVYGSGSTAILKDFKELEIHGKGSPLKKKLFTQDKGQKEMIKTFIESVRTGVPSQVPFEDSYTVTLTTFKILESLRKKQKVDIRP